MFQQYSARQPSATDDTVNANDVERHRVQPHQQPKGKVELGYTSLGAGTEIFYGNASQSQASLALPPALNPILSTLIKPKVLSPAPLKMYGKPESLTTGQQKVAADVGLERVQSVHDSKFTGMTTIYI